MVGLMAQIPEMDANCAICGAPPVPECPHEGERLKLALDQAMERWAGVQSIREWVLNHARNQIITTFNHLRAIRMQQHASYLETLPFYTLIHRYNHPPLQPAQLQVVHAQMAQANALLQAGVDQDWRTSCQRYPEVLDYYFNLVDVAFPSESDPEILDPRFGAAAGGGGGGAAAAAIAGAPSTTAGKDSRRVKQQRRDSMEMIAVREREHRRRERRRSRGRTPPPAPQVPVSYHRR